MLGSVTPLDRRPIDWASVVIPGAIAVPAQIGASPYALLIPTENLSRFTDVIESLGSLSYGDTLPFNAPWGRTANYRERRVKHYAQEVKLPGQKHDSTLHSDFVVMNLEERIDISIAGVMPKEGKPLTEIKLAWQQETRSSQATEVPAPNSKNAWIFSHISHCIALPPGYTLIISGVQGWSLHSDGKKEIYQEKILVIRTK